MCPCFQIWESEAGWDDLPAWGNVPTTQHLVDLPSQPAATQANPGNRRQCPALCHGQDSYCGVNTVTPLPLTDEQAEAER